VIHYDDYIDNGGTNIRRSLILDFEDNLKYVYPLLFERMAKSRPFQTATTSSISNNSDLIIRSERPSLLLSVEVVSPTITAGKQQKQKIVVGVSNDKSNEKVIGARISGEIVYPSGSRVLLEEDTTDSDGRVSYSWTINNNSELGIYRVNLYSSASGYRTSTTKATFEVK
jgi:5-hydroxyisourate hydrolase-like protein (transthyretin family)